MGDEGSDGFGGRVRHDGYHSRPERRAIGKNGCERGRMEAGPAAFDAGDIWILDSPAGIRPLMEWLPRDFARTFSPAPPCPKHLKIVNPRTPAQSSRGKMWRPAGRNGGGAAGRWMRRWITSDRGPNPVPSAAWPGGTYGGSTSAAHRGPGSSCAGARMADGLRTVPAASGLLSEDHELRSGPESRGLTGRRPQGSCSMSSHANANRTTSIRKRQDSAGDAPIAGP